MSSTQNRIAFITIYDIVIEGHWTQDEIIFALQFKMLSNKAYRFVRLSKAMALPGRSTLQVCMYHMILLLMWKLKVSLKCDLDEDPWLPVPCRNHVSDA